MLDFVCNVCCEGVTVAVCCWCSDVMGSMQKNCGEPEPGDLPSTPALGSGSCSGSPCMMGCGIVAGVSPGAVTCGSTVLALTLCSTLGGSGRLGLTISERAVVTVTVSSMYAPSDWLYSKDDRLLDIVPSPTTFCTSSSLINTMQCFSNMWGINYKIFWRIPLNFLELILAIPVKGAEALSKKIYL